MSDTNRRSQLAITAAGAAAFTAGPALSRSASTSPQPSSGAGRTALVTGSSRGIGAATAKRLARDGFAVTVNYFTNRELAAQVVREIEAGGGRAIYRQADVADPAAVRALFDAHQEAFGGLDVVVNNAGAMNVAPFAQMTDDAFDRMMATNIKGSFNVLREAANRTRDGFGRRRRQSHPRLGRSDLDGGGAPHRRSSVALGQTAVRAGHSDPADPGQRCRPSPGHPWRPQPLLRPQQLRKAPDGHPRPAARLHCRRRSAGETEKSA